MSDDSQDNKGFMEGITNWAADKTHTDDPPSYIGGDSVDSLLDKQKAKGGITGAAAGAIADNLRESQKTGFNKFLSQLSELANQLIYMLMGFFFPDSRAAEVGLREKIQESSAFDAVEQKLGLEGVSNDLKKITKKNARDFVGWFGMPRLGENGEQPQAYASIVKQHQSIFKYLDKSLAKKYPADAGYDPAAIQKMAAQAAASLSGIPLSSAIAATAEDFVYDPETNGPITTGYGASLLKAQRDAKLEGRTKGTYDESDVPAITINGEALQVAVANITAAPAPAPDPGISAAAVAAAAAAARAGATGTGANVGTAPTPARTPARPPAASTQPITAQAH